MTSQNHKSSQPLPRNYNNKNQQSSSLLYPRQTKQPHDHKNYGNNSKDHKYDNSYIAPHLDNPQRQASNNSEQRITQLEQQVQSLLNSVKTLQEGKSKVDKKIVQTRECSVKTPKRSSPYEQTSYRSAKTRYNLRGNKQENITADDSEQPTMTDEDTDAPDNAVMSDGAVFEGIIDELSNTTPTETKFSVKSYNPLNLLQFNATR
ncbi:hypothetical protein RhiirC2_796943 [Rhizophagus irregularis]|uniref:Uncharacterized protein n=1 Tax=Rhizophagus irregularis TaxID=588596 RepID=A0A2N1M8U9_9GLOM|nr:hypothetical protein RhiirC2_796943 [Rhizophagus irregularis]